MNNLIELYKAYQAGQRPPETMPLDEWSDKYRFINEVSGEKWLTKRVEVARGPMRAVTEPGVRTITVMCCTQLMKTELILNTIGYFMHLDPCPMLVVQPKEELAKKFSNVRLKQMIKSTPALKDKITESNRRHAADTTTYKEFPGGHVTIVSSRSPSNLAMLPIRLVLLDEIDKYEESSGHEGDPIDLAEERMATYSANSLSIRVCSPTIKHLSRIEESYETSDKRKPFVKCSHCGGWQIMLWPNVHWEKDEHGNHLPETAQYCCTHCGVAWTESERLKVLKDIDWRQTVDFACGKCSHENKPSTWDPNDRHKWNEAGYAMCEECQGSHAPNKHAGFWASKLYSPFRPLSEMAQKWIDAQGNVEKLKTFINTQLAETFEEAGQSIDNVEWLMSRRERYNAELPNGVGIITAGIDTQDNRLEIEVIGWGEDEESWSLDYKVIPGDPSQPEIWKQLTEYLNRPWFRADGRLSYIAAACIDMQGGHTQHVAMYCRDKIGRRIWPIRGVGGDGRPYPVWPKNPGRTSKSQVPFYNIGVDSAKNTVFSRLHITKQGPGFCHFPQDREPDWFTQLIAERRVLRYKGTQRFYRWENPKKARNEAFDCRVYGYAALVGLQELGWSVNLVTKEERLIMGADYDDRRRRSLRKQEEKAQQKEPESKQVNSKPKRKVVKSSFMES